MTTYAHEGTQNLPTVPARTRSKFPWFQTRIQHMLSELCHHLHPFQLLHATDLPTSPSRNKHLHRPLAYSQPRSLASRQPTRHTSTGRTLHPTECTLRNLDSNAVMHWRILWCACIAHHLYHPRSLVPFFFCTVVAQQFHPNMVIPSDHLFQSFRFQVSIVPKIV
jgi:hypothetical protein